MDWGERQLLEGCRRGSSEARERFARQYAGLVHWAVRKTLSANSQAGVEAADVFQDVFRKIFEPGTLDRIRDAQALKTWLVVISCRTALDAGRRGSRRLGRESSLEALTEEGLTAVAEQAEPSSDPAQRVLESEKTRVVQDLMSVLPPRERACMRFHYMDGMTHLRIGEILGISKDAVSAIIRRSRDRLRESLKSRGIQF